MTVAAQKGNQFWKVRSTHGRKPIFANPEELWDACAEYFEWVEETPLYETRPFHYQGKVVDHKVPKMHAMTIGGLCVFLDIAQDTWFRYAKQEGFSEVCARVTEIIRTQKFKGAAADLLNPAIIARDLGLADKRELSGPSGGPIPVISSDMDPQQAADLYADTLKGD